MATTKPIDSAILRACLAVKKTIGDDAFALYQAQAHRMVVAMSATQSLIDKGILAKAKAPDAFLAIVERLAGEATMLEHSNFKQNRLRSNGLVPPADEKPTLSATTPLPDFE
jgi:hypothetical protein